MPTPEARIATPQVQTNNLKGILWMLLTGVLFIGVTGVVRHLGTDMSAYQSAFIRYFFGLLLMIPVYWSLLRNWRGPLRLPPQSSLHVLRGLIHGTGVMLWFYAMARIPIAEVTALGYTAPIFTTIGAAIFLGERLRARRVAAVAVGFLGTLVILRPGLVEIQPGAVAQLCAAPLFACSFLIAKKLTQTYSPGVIVASLSIFVTVTLLPPALYHWRTPTMDELFWLFITASLATAGHYTLVQAFRHTEITVTQPFTFLQLVWATLLGYYVFGEEPEVWVWVGAAIIISCATYIAHREARARGRADPKIPET